MGLRCVMYTAAFGRANEELAGISPIPGWDLKIFSDRKDSVARCAHHVVAQPCSFNPRISAKYFKIRPDLLFPEYDVSLYFDANVRFRAGCDAWLSCLLQRPERLLCFRHNRRLTTGGEWLRVLLYGKEDPIRWLRVVRLLIQGQVTRAPAIQGGLLLRRHSCPIVTETMKIWWDLILQHSERDQALFALAAKATGLRTGFIEGVLHDSPHTCVTPHRNVRFDRKGRERWSIRQSIAERYRQAKLRRWQPHPDEAAGRHDLTAQRAAAQQGARDQ